jgi:hypothetical protein
MKSLDINLASPNLEVDASQRVTIEFTGGNHFDRMQGANTVTVPYSSLSKRMQTIQRFGGKITNISIQRLQLDLPRINSEVNSAQDQEHDLEETPAIAPTVEPEEISEVIPEIIVKDVSVDISNNIQVQEPVAIAEVVPVPEPIVEVIRAIVPEPISEQVVENAKPLTEAAIKPKKTKASTKAHGFSKKESSPQVQEPVANVNEIVPIPEPVAEIIPDPEPVVEITPEISPEQVSHSATNNSSAQDLKQIELTSEHVTEAVLDITLEPMLETSMENDFEVTEPVSNVEITIESSAPLPPSKSKKSKTSSKSGNGFNKLKSDTQAPRSQRKPKI